MSWLDRVWAGAMWPIRIQRSTVVPVPGMTVSILGGITAAESRTENSGSENGYGHTWGTARCWTTMPANAAFQPRDACIDARFPPLQPDRVFRRCRFPWLHRLPSGPNQTDRIPSPVATLVRPGAVIW